LFITAVYQDFTPIRQFCSQPPCPNQHKRHFIAGPLVASDNDKTLYIMKATLFCIFLYLGSQPTYSQICIKNPSVYLRDSVGTKSLDPIYFVLGTLSDYMGRFQYVEKEMQVDRYYPYEKPLVEYLTKYIKTELEIKVDTVFEKSNHCKMFSESLSKTLNSFYGDKDELLRGKFETNKQIYSFLTGVYYRYGEKLDTSIYKIQLANSPKHQNCYEFLKQIGCENIFFQYLRNIPAQYILYFEPTDELKEYFDIIDPERIILNKSFYALIEEMMKGQMTKEQLDVDFQKSKNIEINKIKNAFKR
jgi:hypothetical protein